jgi:hypothetical protein
MNRMILCLFIFFMPYWVMAKQNTAKQTTQSIGQFAGELIGPVTILSNFISNGSIIIGVMSLFAALMRYMQYRVNPLASPISTVIVLVILGILLICLPFTYLLTGAGIPFLSFGMTK